MVFLAIIASKNIQVLLIESSCMVLDLRSLYLLGKRSHLVGLVRVVTLLRGVRSDDPFKLLLFGYSLDRELEFLI